MGFWKKSKRKFYKIDSKIRGIQGTGWDGEKKNLKK